MALASPAARQKPHSGPRLVAKAAPELVPEIGWTPRGSHRAWRVSGVLTGAKVYRDPQLQRWVCAVQFDVMRHIFVKDASPADMVSQPWDRRQAACFEARSILGCMACGKRQTTSASR